MLTQCPKCQTTFRVTAAMLKAAKGRVRCGRCAQVFDALAHSVERRARRRKAAAAGDKSSSRKPAQESSRPSAAPPAASVDDDGADIPESAMEFHLSPEELSKVFVIASAPILKIPVAGAPPRIEEPTAELEIPDIDAEAGAPVESITLEGDSIESTSNRELEPSPRQPSVDAGKKPARAEPSPTRLEAGAAAPVPKMESRAEATARIDAEVRREIEAAFAADPTTTAEFVLPSGTRLTLNREPEPHEVLAPPRARLRITPSKWMAGSAVLALLLIVQLVHANRQSLVRSPLLGRPLGAIYASLGAELSPAWDVSAYQLRQWGAAADPGSSGTLRVRASVLNGADHAQPYPLLRLTLQDRFGSEVASRDLEPREYLNGEPDGNRLLGAGQRVDAEIAIVDPGKDAVGFQIDVCLRDNARTTCATEPSGSSG